MENIMGLQVSDEKLKLNKRLSYIKLPKEKVDLFINWYNNDLRKLDLSVPQVFTEGYLEIDLSEIIKYKSPSIFEFKTQEEYQNIKDAISVIENIYGSIIIYFETINDNTFIINGYCKKYGEMLFKKDINPKRHFLVDKIRNLVKGTIAAKNVDREINVDIEDNTTIVSNTIKYNLTVKSSEEYTKMQNKFNEEICDVCSALFIAVFWYLATNKTEKYIVTDETKIIEARKFIKQNQKKSNYNRKITTPLYYDLTDKKEITVEKLIIRRTGWTISHSFQVRGHYRHYKNGKTVFIKPFEKGKDLDKVENKIITISPNN